VIERANAWALVTAWSRTTKPRACSAGTARSGAARAHRL